MLIAEDLILLLTDGTTGKPVADRTRMRLGTAGACVIDLALQGKVSVAGEADDAKSGRLVVSERAPTGDHILDTVLQRCTAERGARPQRVLRSTGKFAHQELVHRLCDRGVLREERHKVLGLFPVTRWPPNDTTSRQKTLADVGAALLDGVRPDRRTAALAVLVTSVGAATTVLDVRDRAAIRRRAKEIRDGDTAADAMGSAIEAVQTAIMAAIVGATVAAGAAGGGGA